MQTTRSARATSLRAYACLSKDSTEDRWCRRTLDSSGLWERKEALAEEISKIGEEIGSRLRGTNLGF